MDEREDRLICGDARSLIGDAEVKKVEDVDKKNEDVDKNNEDESKKNEDNASKQVVAKDTRDANVQTDEEEKMKTKKTKNKFVQANLPKGEPLPGHPIVRDLRGLVKAIFWLLAAFLLEYDFEVIVFVGLILGLGLLLALIVFGGAYYYVGEPQIEVMKRVLSQVMSAQV